MYFHVLIGIHIMYLFKEMFTQILSLYFIFFKLSSYISVPVLNIALLWLVLFACFCQLDESSSHLRRGDLN